MEKIISKNQSGGITTGVINYWQTKEKPEKQRLIIIISIIMLVISVFTFFGVDKMFGKEKDSNKFEVISYNQSGGITAGEINVDKIIVTDKESLGIRDENGLYKNNEKVGTVFGATINEKENIINITSIRMNRVIEQEELYTPYEFRNYKILFNGAQEVVMIAPPGMKFAQFRILEKI